MAQQSKKKSISRTPEDEYLRFIKAIKLKGIGLDSAAMSIDRKSLSGAEKSGESLSIQLTAQPHVAKAEDKRFVVATDYKISIGRPNVSTSVGEIKCTFSALFEIGSDANQQFLERFAAHESRLVFWPYLRHFVADTSYRMAINPILIPLTSETGN